MMYTSNHVVCIKVNSKILREDNQTVKVPFGSEYSVLLKNLNSVRALASISIDGKPVCDSKFIIEANSSIEVERFVKENDRGNRFKFIERTEAIEKHRGVQADDGLVRVEFWKEVIQFEYNNNSIFPYHKPCDYPHWPNNRPLWKSMLRSNGNTSSRRIRPSGISGQSVHTTMDSGFSETSCSVNDAGITAAGSISDQRFTEGSWFETEAQSTVITLNLKGKIKGVEIVKPLTVQRKLSCESCGLKNKSSNKFCSRCGTHLKSSNFLLDFY